jgi:hypothetical protein
MQQLATAKNWPVARQGLGITAMENQWLRREALHL